MGRQLSVYNGTVFPSTSANTASTVVERDENKNIVGNELTGAAALISQGSLFFHVVTVTDDVTLDDSLTVCCGDATSGAFAVTLPPVASCVDQALIIKKIDSTSNHITVTGNGSEEEIDGSNTFVVTTQYQHVMVISDGTTWHIIG